ncbi:MAG: glycosyltransferase, partial [Muribaculaceae bacterium]|nr:glycosyltransferase [Muribaculaceae bacterium]
YINTSAHLYISGDDGSDGTKVMNFRGWIKAIGTLSKYVPPSECFFLFKLHSLYRDCIMRGAMFSSHDPTIKALKAEGKRYDLDSTDKRILRLLRSRRLRRREWSHGPLVPSASDVLISMVMASYNDGELMMKAVRSLQAQTFMHWELLIIDDSSNDRTPELIRSIGTKDARIRWIRTSKSIGRYRISRLGIAAARGEYIGFLNPDDKLEKRSLEYMWQRASATDADMVVMGSRLISTHGWLTFPQFDPSRVFDRPMMNTYDIMGPMLCGTGLPWQQYGRIYRREYLRNADMTVSFDREDHMFNLLAMLTEGTVAWTDYMGYINRHSTYADLPLTEQWKKMLMAFHSSARLLEERGWMGHTEWRDEQLRALGETFVEKMSGALVFEPQSRVLRCVEE